MTYFSTLLEVDPQGRPGRRGRAPRHCGAIAAPGAAGERNTVMEILIELRNEPWFQLLSGLASIASLPLAVFLFIRAREPNYVKIREEIVRTLLTQLSGTRS